MSDKFQVGYKIRSMDEYDQLPPHIRFNSSSWKAAEQYFEANKRVRTPAMLSYIQKHCPGDLIAAVQELQESVYLEIMECMRPVTIVGENGKRQEVPCGKLYVGNRILDTACQHDHDKARVPLIIIDRTEIENILGAKTILRTIEINSEDAPVATLDVQKDISRKELARAIQQTLEVHLQRIGFLGQSIFVPEIDLSDIIAEKVAHGNCTIDVFLSNAHIDEEKGILSFAADVDIVCDSEESEDVLAETVAVGLAKRKKSD